MAPHAIIVIAVEAGLLSFGIGRRAFELLQTSIDDIAASFCIVAQFVPRQRVIAAAPAEQGAGGQNRIFRLAGALFDHETVDRAQLLSLAVIDRSSLDLLGRDQS